MRQFIIGTAGHIDHGKTSLVKALTNIDCDTHPEEKRRGITINLGFAYIKRADGDYMAFVDVPGHHKFISNMVAGASGIDFVMLVVAANDGIMPQTREHLKICSLLGIKSGIVVINKCDTVDADDIELCTEEVEEHIKGTFLEGKPIFKVSALSGEGIGELRNYLLSDNYSVTKREERSFFRMSVDRTFNVSGFGVVVTGTVAQHQIAVGDTVTLMPKAIKGKVRGIQRHTEQITSVGQGSRVAIDLTGLKLEDVTMGDILCEVAPTSTCRLDAALTYMDNSSAELPSKFDAIMLIGTAKLSVKVKILGRLNEQGEHEAAAQIDLPREWLFAVGDHFILRNSSSDHTIAGGVVIDPLSLNHRKINPQLLGRLSALATSTLGYIESKVLESVTVTPISLFRGTLQLSEPVLREIVATSNVITLFDNGGLISTAKVEEFTKLLLAGFEKYVKTNPLSVIGVQRKQLLDFVKGYIVLHDPKSNDEAISLILDSIERNGTLLRNGNNWRLPNMRAEISDRERRNIEKIEQIIEGYQFTPFDINTLFDSAESVGIAQRDCKHIFTYLNELKRVSKVGNEYLSASKLNSARKQLLEYLDSNPEGIKTAEYRDLVGVNRKVAVILLEHFDSEKIVYRDGEVRRKV